MGHSKKSFYVLIRFTDIGETNVIRLKIKTVIALAHLADFKVGLY